MPTLMCQELMPWRMENAALAQTEAPIVP